MEQKVIVQHIHILLDNHQQVQGAPQTTGTNILKATSKIDKQCNIFDMAGNCRDWTTETCSNSDNPCVYRGR